MALGHKRRRGQQGNRPVPVLTWTWGPVKRYHDPEIAARVAATIKARRAA